jgi:cytochrome c biogenesis protein CcdA
VDRKLTLVAAAGLLLVAVVLALKIGTFGTTALWNASAGGQWLLPLLLAAALVDSVNPCAFSILIVTIAFLLSIGKLRSNVLWIGAAYIVGIFLVYLLIGLGLLQTLHIFDTPHFMAKAGATLLVLLGLVNLTNQFVPAFPIRPAIPQAAHRKIAVLMERASVPTAFLLGGLVGVCEFPCTGGPYLMAIGLLHDQTTYFAGAGYLVLYNVIFVLPLALILLIASDASVLARVQAWQQQKKQAMRLGGGTAMVALGLLIFAM